MRKKKSSYGVVILKDWMQNPDQGQNVISVSGPLEFVHAKEDFGFMPKGNETNWGIRVGSDKAGVLILGCQIRGIYWGKQLKTRDNVNWAF